MFDTIYFDKKYTRPLCNSKINSDQIKEFDIERFMISKEMNRTLNELWDRGVETLDIYYPEDMTQGEELWAVGVYQDEVNERCRCSLNWTWTVISKKQIEADGEKEDGQPEWVITIDFAFSDEAIRGAVNKWLKDRSYGFEVRMTPFEKTKGSGREGTCKDSQL